MSEPIFNHQPVTTSVYAFIAPVKRELNQPTVFDPSGAKYFDIEKPTAPWIRLGRVENFQRTAGDEVAAVQAGPESAVVAQFRKRLEAHVSFEFRSWGKLQLAMATGGTHWNVLESSNGASPAAIGGEAIPAIPILDGSTATLVKVDPQAASRFSVGDFIAVDEDYLQQVGYLGSGFAAAYVATGQDTSPGTDFIRRVTHNVAQIVEVDGGSLHLQNPLPAGDPPSSAALQKVVGFVDREGGTFRQEWSALFVEETACGGKVCYYYPRLQSVPPASEKKTAILGDYLGIQLRAHLLALPATDPQDGAAALWYRVYVPPVCGS